MNPLNVGTLPACQRLMNAGIVLETDAKWILWPTGLIELVGRAEYRDADVKVYYAPSMAEVWRELPGTEELMPLLAKYAKGKNEFWYAMNPIRFLIELFRDIDRMISLLIWLTEQRKEKV